MKRAIKKNTYILYLYYRYRMFINRNFHKKNISLYLSKIFLKKVGYELKLEEPKSFNEKLQWLKLNWYDPEAIICADKFLVRDYIKNNGYESLLNEIYGAYRSFDEIDFDKLPQKFVLKASHCSGFVKIIKDKEQINIKSMRREIKRWLKVNYSYLDGEWVYDSNQPRIICEKLIETESGKLPIDYKFFCFNGIPKFLFVATDRGNDTKFNFFDMDWNQIPVKQHYPLNNNSILKPDNYEKMIEIASNLSKKFPHVRIDMYSDGKEIIFGEMTFFHFSGTVPFEPVEYDFRFGEFLNIERILEKYEKQ